MTFFAAVQNVRYWHKADITAVLINVRYWHKADITAVLRYWG